MKTHYIDILIFSLSGVLLIFAIILWRSRPKIDSSEEDSLKKSKKNKDRSPGDSNL